MGVLLRGKKQEKHPLGIFPLRVASRTGRDEQMALDRYQRRFALFGRKVKAGVFEHANFADGTVLLDFI